MEEEGSTALSPARSHPSDDLMRKTVAALLIVALAWIGYTVWPIYELGVLVRAIETRDIDKVTHRIYFDAVRMSLTNQNVAAFVRRTGIQISPRAQHMSTVALGIAHPVVERLISAQALADLLGTGWPVTVVPDPPPGTIGINSNTIGTVWQIFAGSEYGISRFEISAPVALAPAERFRLTFRLLQWRWRLVAVTLPEGLQNLLADELDKARRAPAPAR
jgi:hypothetical protein